MPTDFSWPEMRLSQEAYVDSVLAEEMIQFDVSAANPVRVPAGQSQGFLPVRPPRPSCHTRLQKGREFSRQSAIEPPQYEGGDCRQDPTCQLNTCVQGKVVKKIGDLLDT